MKAMRKVLSDFLDDLRAEEPIRVDWRWTGDLVTDWMSMLPEGARTAVGLAITRPDLTPEEALVAYGGSLTRGPKPVEGARPRKGWGPVVGGQHSAAARTGREFLQLLPLYRVLAKVFFALRESPFTVFMLDGECVWTGDEIERMVAILEPTAARHYPIERSRREVNRIARRKPLLSTVEVETSVRRALNAQFDELTAYRIFKQFEEEVLIWIRKAESE